MSDMIFNLKTILFLGKLTAILCQNENGPCPLLAMANVMVLQRKIDLNIYGSTITLSELVQVVANVVIQDVESKKTINSGLSSPNDSANIEHNVLLESVLNILPKLANGLDLNVFFTSVSKFEFTPEISVFDSLSIALLHGWLVDPKEDYQTYEILRNLSYNHIVMKLVEYKALCDKIKSAEELSHQVYQAQITSNNLDLMNAEPSDIPQSYTPTVEEETLLIHGKLIEEFLFKSATQLTEIGLHELYNTMKDRQLVVFFRNNHFSTLFSYNGQLFNLVTDSGYLHEPSVVWEILDGIDGSSEYYNDSFHPLSGDTSSARLSHTQSDQTALFASAAYPSAPPLDAHKRLYVGTVAPPAAPSVITSSSNGSSSSGISSSHSGTIAMPPAVTLVAGTVISTVDSHSQPSVTHVAQAGEEEVDLICFDAESPVPTATITAIESDMSTSIDPSAMKNEATEALQSSQDDGHAISEVEPAAAGQLRSVTVSVNNVSESPQIEQSVEVADETKDDVNDDGCDGLTVGGVMTRTSNIRNIQQQQQQQLSTVSTNDTSNHSNGSSSSFNSGGYGLGVGTGVGVGEFENEYSPDIDADHRLALQLQAELDSDNNNTSSTANGSNSSNFVDSYLSSSSSLVQLNNMVNNGTRMTHTNTNTNTNNNIDGFTATATAADDETSLADISKTLITFTPYSTDQDAIQQELEQIRLRNSPMMQPSQQQQQQQYYNNNGSSSSSSSSQSSSNKVVSPFAVNNGQYTDPYSDTLHSPHSLAHVDTISEYIYNAHTDNYEVNPNYRPVDTPKRVTVSSGTTAVVRSVDAQYDSKTDEDPHHHNNQSSSTHQDIGIFLSQEERDAQTAMMLQYEEDRSVVLSPEEQRQARINENRRMHSERSRHQNAQSGERVGNGRKKEKCIIS